MFMKVKVLRKIKNLLRLKSPFSRAIKTLTDEEIEVIASKVIVQVKKTTGGEIRG